MLIAFVLFGCALVFASIVFLFVFFISDLSDRRARQMQDEQTLNHLRATKFLE